MFAMPSPNNCNMSIRRVMFKLNNAMLLSFFAKQLFLPYTTSNSINIKIEFEGFLKNKKKNKKQYIMVVVFWCRKRSPKSRSKTTKITCAIDITLLLVDRFFLKVMRFTVYPWLSTAPFSCWQSNWEYLLIFEFI